MVCYPPSGYIILSLRNLKFYEDLGPGPDNPKTLVLKTYQNTEIRSKVLFYLMDMKIKAQNVF